jgi:hypothetical protein
MSETLDEDSRVIEVFPLDQESFPLDYERSQAIQELGVLGERM